MRILNQDNDQPVYNVLLMLTAEEANELMYSLDQALHSKDGLYHDDIDDKEFQHEIHFGIYKSDNLNIFNKRVQRLIADDL